MTFKPEFEITVLSDPGSGTQTIKVEGELDSATCDAVVDAFERASADRALERLTLDLSEVSFIDSAGTRAMIMIEQSARELCIALEMSSPPEEVTALLRTAGVVGRISLSPETEAAPRHAEFTERVELDLPRDPQSPSRARVEVRELMSGWVEETELANLILLTSELVTNAVVHPRAGDDAPIGLRITAYGDGVRVEVEDSGEGFDPAAPAVNEQHGGRGLFLVDRCATKWGARSADTDRGPRFLVWFELEWPEQRTATVAGA